MGRQQRRVEREQERARRVHQALGGPHLPTDAAAHRVVAADEADAEHPHRNDGDQREHRQRHQRRHGQHHQTTLEGVEHGVGGVNPPAHQHQADADREQRHAGQEQRCDAVGEDPMGCAWWSFRGPRMIGLADLLSRRTGPHLAGLHASDDGGACRDDRVLADLGAGQQRRAGTDGGTGTDLDAADVDEIAVDPVTGQIDLGLDGAAVTQLEQAGDRREGVQVDALADLGTESARVVDHPRCARQVRRTTGIGQSRCGPEPDVHAPAALVRARFQPGQQDARSDHRDRHAADRGDEQDECQEHPPPGQRRSPGHVAEPGHDVEQQSEPGDPLQSGQGGQRNGCRDLRPLRGARGRGDFTGNGLDDRLQVVEILRQRTQPRVVVELRDGDLGEPLAQRRHQLRGRQRTATVGEEIGVLVRDLRAEDVGPQFGHPPRRAAERGGTRHAGQGPRQRIAVDLARGARWHLVDQRQAWDQGRRQLFGEQLARGFEIEIGVGAREIPDEHRVTGSRLADGGRRTADARKCLQRIVYLAELDASTAELDLVVGATLEQQTFELQLDQISAAIRPFPPEGRHGRVLLGVLGRVEIPSESDAPDDQLTDFADLHRGAGAVDDSEVPSIEGEPDPDRTLAVHDRRTRDDRRLGGAVGVPDLTALDGEPLGQLRRAGFAAEDEQPHRFQRHRGPQRRQRRDRRDDTDVAGDEPRAEVEAGPHQRPGRGNQTRSVPPRQPHLLARRVERHRQSGQHSVARTERILLQEHAGLGVDERRCVAMTDGNPLGSARRTRGEDDPRVVLRGGRSGIVFGEVVLRNVLLGGSTGRDAARGDDGRHLRLAEDQLGPLLGVVRVHRHVGSTDREDRQDRDVEGERTRRHADSDAIAAPDTGVGEPLSAFGDVVQQLGVADRHGTVVDRGGVGETMCRVAEDVDERPGGWSLRRAKKRRRGRCCVRARTRQIVLSMHRQPGVLLVRCK